MNRYALSRSRVDRALLRRKEAAAHRAASDQAVVDHVAAVRVFEIARKKVARFEGVRVSLTDDDRLSFEVQESVWQWWAFGMVLLGWGAFVALFKPELYPLGTAGVVFGCLLLGIATTSRPRRLRALVAADDTAASWLHSVPRGEGPAAVRRRIKGDLSRVPGATLTDLPSVWDRIVKRVRRGA
ncbi:hypothetical protein ACFWHR_12130 [Leucobacter sp. NPDC058333]|uniref:hypothetical protein n=1 Tax=Leucobacter sp. NPDC058333 TaxID=3346450 RepID=UPI00364AF65E